MMATPLGILPDAIAEIRAPQPFRYRTEIRLAWQAMKKLRTRTPLGGKNRHRRSAQAPQKDRQTPHEHAIRIETATNRHGHLVKHIALQEVVGGKRHQISATTDVLL
jgi:hypothetical protein